MAWPRFAEARILYTQLHRDRNMDGGIMETSSLQKNKVLYTIGFTGKSAEEFFSLLKKSGVRILLDIRLNNVSQLAGFTKVRISHTSSRRYWTANITTSPTLQKGDCEKAVRSINEELKGKKIYLRLGLARPYGNIPEPYRGWCALQVNGFHTIPDLYEGDYNNWIRLE